MEFMLIYVCAAILAGRLAESWWEIFIIVPSYMLVMALLFKILDLVYARNDVETDAETDANDPRWVEEGKLAYVAFAHALRVQWIGTDETLPPEWEGVSAAKKKAWVNVAKVIKRGELG